VQYADRVISLASDGTAVDGLPAEVLAGSAVAPPIVELGRLARWHPLPLSVRDARRRAAPLRARIVRSTAVAPTRVAPGAPVLDARGLEVRHGRVHAVRGVDLTVRTGEVVAVMGRNGAGKSSLLWALQGSGPRSGGTVRINAPSGDVDPAALRPAQARRLVALVPQTPSDLLYRDTVRAECDAGDVPGSAGATHRLLTRIAGPVALEAHPRDLSEGQRLALVLAIQLAAAPPVLLLDEPTRGLDYQAKHRLTGVLADLASAGGAVLLSSHDVEFVAGCADRVIVLADGEIVSDGAAAEVLVASPVFAPQVAKVLYPLGLLTVEAVRSALGIRP